MPRVEYRYCCTYSAALCRALDEADVGYTVDALPEKIVICTLDGETLQGRALQPLLDASRITCLSSLRFTEREREKAAWLTLRCGCNKLVPADGAMPFVCRAPGQVGHSEQIASFTLQRDVRWGARGFVTALENASVLFLSARVRRILEGEGLAGLAFLPVYRVGESAPLDDVFQLATPNLLPRDALELPAENIAETHACPHCGRRQYVLKGHAQLRIKKAALSAEKDIYFTDELFGAGIPQRGILVSQKFYQCIKRNALGRGLSFEPVILSDAKGREEE